MRTLVGVDHDRAYVPALELLARLRFRESNTTLAHVGPQIEDLLALDALSYDGHNPDVTDAMSDSGNALLATAVQEARRLGLGDRIETQYTVGHASQSLMNLADEHRSDLVAIGSTHHGPLESFFLGSVGRAFAVGGRSSFLIAREPRGNSGAVNAVFATDHSENADRCFARLLDMAPEGLEHVTVVTAMKSKPIHGEGEGGAPYGSSPSEDRMRTHGKEMVARLQAKGIGAKFRMEPGHPAAVLKAVMEETQADLMILAARGHGLIERVFIGSFALHAVVAEAYSVLVIRMPEEA